MKTATRPRAGPARALVLPLLAILFLGTIASPALGETDGPDEGTDLTTAAAEGKSCPQDDGWIKVDDIDGGSGTRTGDPDSDLGDFGTISWDDDTVSWVLNPDFVLDLCIKSGAQSGAMDPTEHLGLTGSGSVTTTGPDEGGQELSHISYRIAYLPPPPPPPPADGSVTVAKTVTGEGHAPAGDFTFVIRDRDQVLTTIDLADGATSTPYAVPADTTLTVEETVDHDADATTWRHGATDGTGTTTDPLTIGESEHVTITFTNRFDADDPPPPPPPPVDGTVTVVKEVTGDGDHPDEAFTFTVVGDDGTALTTPIRVEDGGTSAAIPVPADTTLTVEETVDHDADATTWRHGATDGTGTTTDPLTIGENEHVTITFTNRYDAPETRPVTEPVTEVESEIIEKETEEPAVPDVVEDPEVEVLAEVLEREALPRTGADATRLAVLGGLLLLLGTALLRQPATGRR